jgi:5-methylthioadenosine/S-adenosylhomocysteine deaminase
MTDILIRNGFIATMDRQGTVYRRGSLYVKDDRIVEVGEKVDAPRSPECVLDAEHRVVLPGFINAHAHLQQYFRGVYELIGEFYQVNLPLEGYRRPDDMESLGLASCAEFIYGGCTTAMVIYTYPDGFARAVEKAGNRCILAADIEEVDLDRLSEGVYDYLPEKGAAAFKRAVDLYTNWHGKAGGRITTVMAPKAPDLATAETYLKCKEFADKHGLRMTTHLSQSWREVKQVEKLYGKTPPQHLHDLGILNARLTGAHCTYVTQKDIQLIANSGMGILHCRAVTNPLVRWMDMGIPLGLGTDDYHHDMLQLLRQNIAGQEARARLIEGAEEMLASNRTTFRPTFYELIELATRRGAETLGIDGEVGSLEPGKKADIITVNMCNPYLTPTKDPLTSIVLYGSSADIDTVIVDGRILKRDGVLTSIDMRQSLTAAQSKVEEIIGRFFQEHPQQRQVWEQKVPYMK